MGFGCLASASKVNSRQAGEYASTCRGGFPYPPLSAKKKGRDIPPFDHYFVFRGGSAGGVDHSRDAQTVSNVVVKDGSEVTRRVRSALHTAHRGHRLLCWSPCCIAAPVVVTPPTSPERLDRTYHLPPPTHTNNHNNNNNNEQQQEQHHRHHQQEQRKQQRIKFNILSECKLSLERACSVRRNRDLYLGQTLINALKQQCASTLQRAGQQSLDAPESRVPCTHCLDLPFRISCRSDLCAEHVWYSMLYISMFDPAKP